VQLPGQLYGLATGDFSKTGALGLGEDISKYGEEMKSPGLKAREAERSAKVQEAEKQGQWEAFKAGFGETVTDPALFTSFLAEQAPQIIPMILTGGAASAFTAGKASAAALAKGATKEAAATAAKQAGIKAGTSAAIQTGAVMQGADVGAGAYDDIYKELREKGLSEEQAASETINKARAAGLAGYALSVLTNRYLPGSKALEEVLAGKALTGSRIGSGAVTALKEIPGENIEEVGGKVAQNIAAQQAGIDRELMAGTGETAAMATVGAAGMGGVAGLAAKRTAQPEVPVAPKAPAVEPIKPTQAPVGPVSATPPEAAPEPLVETPPAVEPVAIEPTPPTAPITPMEPVAQPEPAKKEQPKAEDWDANYTENLPPEAGTFFQNRDRSSPASVGQMQSIAANPDYSRLSVGRDFGSGAPVVISDLPISDDQFGKVAYATASDGTRIPVRYAVVEGNNVTPSNTSDGTKNPEYGDLSVTGIRPIAGNGRVAGLRAAYSQGTAENYKRELLEDTEHGINPSVISGFENPVLVRVMPKSKVTANIADISNISGTLRLSPVESAKNDINRVDLNGLTFNDDGSPNTNTLIQFVRSMPKDEQGELIDAKGMPNTKAIDRLNNAIFYKAYGSDNLIELYAQAADQEAKAVLNALAKAAPKMAALEGAGDYDVRSSVLDAAEMAVNARRAGQKLKDYAQQGVLGADPYALKVLDMFAENSRSSKRMAEALDRLATKAAEQANASDTDMFGDVPKIPKDDLYKALLLEPEAEPDLFAPPAAPAEPQAAEPVAAPAAQQSPRPQSQKLQKHPSQKSLPTTRRTSLSSLSTNQWRILPKKSKGYQFLNWLNGL
jgi:hypothetical protein